jgi:transcriptional regulator GlxA family with amidase domain
MAQVRLEEVARQLVQTDATLATVASETGFADANHLCKAFRRHYHLSPGTFRKQMR